MQANTINFASADCKSTINAIEWNDSANTEPKGIVQIIHGMAEHIMRYEDFAAYLVSQGFIVCGHDHIGHGKSVADKKDWGHYDVKNGKDVLVADVHTLRGMMEQAHPGLPYFMFGHSMGSFVLRVYLARHGEGLSGAIICGTGNTPAGTSKAGNTLCRALAKLRGPRHRSKLVDGMAAGGYGKKIEGATGPYDWLSHNVDNVRRYEADEACGFMFSVQAYAAVTDMTGEVATAECAAKYPNELPLLYIAGAEDPVGDFGTGVKASVKLAVDGGSEDVSSKIYEGKRHEILNEDGNQEVYADVSSWIENRL